EDSSGASGENPPDEGGENPGGGDGGSEEPGSGEEEEPELPLPEEELSFPVIRALLSLPPESFEGHPVTATDISSIEVDEILYTAAQAYAKKLASGSIRSEGASCRKLNSTQTELLYAQPGVYMAELEVCAATGEYANDSRSIRVLPCPAVSAELGGCQKQNRRQSFTVTALQNPAHPLISLRISISEPISGEKINVSYSFGGAQNAPVCSSNIKYRSLEDAGSDEYRIVVRLDFLTKFDEDRILNFEINAKDGRGNTASAASQFKVVKDLPPVARIELADCYYRSENSNIAVINASDAAEGSGNLKRIWDCEGEYTDLAFGSAKNISFLRSGVGNFSVGLTVTDLWSEDTLPEYVSESDHLSSHAAAFSVVDNIAPMVSLELRPAKSIDVLLLAQSERAFELARAKIPQLKAKLSEEGIAANIQIALQHNAGVEVGGTPYLLRQISSPISEKLAGAKRLSFPDIRSPFWNCGHVSADASKIYSMDSSTLSVRSSHGGVSYMKRTYPYHIKAFDANTGEGKWTFNFSENVFPSPSEFKNARLGHDAQEKYLYLISDGKTLLLDKATGTMIKVLDSELGVNNCCHEGRIYSFKEDGIYRIDTDGSESKIYGAEIFCGNNRIRTIAGDELFVERRGFALYLGRFNAETENVSSAALQGTENLSDNKSDCAAIDSRGIVVIRISPCEYRAFGSDGKLLRRTLLDPRTQESVPSFDASSRANYIAGSFMEVTGSAAEENRYYFNYASMNSLLGDYSDSNYIRSGREGYYRSINQVAYAMETAESYIGMVLPCSIIYTNDAIYSKMTEFNFNAKTGAKDIGIMTSTGVPPTGFCGHFEGGSFIGMYHTAKNNIALVVKISESEADEIERLKTKWLPDGENSSCISVDESWDVNAAAAELASKYASDTEAPEKIYRKGETIEYKLFYSDYEGDESKASFWCYEHTPYSDGLFKDSGKILNAPVTSFSQDGKYVLTHWQTDDAGRGKTTAFDKESKAFRMVFYIEGGANAPRVKSIGTEPGKVMVGASYSIKTVVDDRDKDELSVTIEVFRKGESEPVKSYTKNGLKAVNGVYPEVVLADMPKAEAGSYEVVVSVRDATGSGAGVYGFRPEVANSLEGMVGHTDDWESNRQSFNLKYF
ncbi:MAG TPA: hypothetical protein PLO47_04950, partial [Bacillota bacterium]|nr:hypothetical protein [Bacillota bacterium]